MAGNWIKLHRTILDHPVFHDTWLFKLWCWCLLKANHTPGRFQTTPVPTGSFVTGRNRAASELDVHPSKWMRGIERLVELECISVKSNNHFTLVTVCNYTSYQRKTNRDRTTGEQPPDNQTPDSRIARSEQRNSVESEQPTTPAKPVERTELRKPVSAKRTTENASARTTSEQPANTIEEEQEEQEVKILTLSRIESPSGPNLLANSDVGVGGEEFKLDNAKITPTAKTPAKRRSKAPAEYSTAFMNFWEAYPRREAKATAATAFENAVRRLVGSKKHPQAYLDAVTKIIETAALFAKTPKGQSGRYCLLPSTWLNQDRFDDDPSAWERFDDDGRSTTHAGNGSPPQRVSTNPATTVKPKRNVAEELIRRLEQHDQQQGTDHARN